MSLSPINFNGMIQNTAEIGNIKANEDARPEINQQQIMTNANEQRDEQSQSVHETQEKSEKYDLGEGRGGSSYQGNNKKKKQQEKKKISDGVVTKKDGHQSFDITI